MPPSSFPERSASPPSDRTSNAAVAAAIGFAAAFFVGTIALLSAILLYQTDEAVLGALTIALVAGPIVGIVAWLWLRRS